MITNASVVDASGFGLSFNKETKRIDADENAWESYVKMILGKPKEMGVTILDASESSLWCSLDTSGDTSQTESGPRSTTPTSKKTRKSRFFEDIPNPLRLRLIKVFLGLKEDIKASWLFRRLEQAGR
ncbi:hypothetical protein IFM89_015846 [Coptis chinensis]|uniref:Uncharacterized protein n=1 Tax=Coptis chinensis TaxID=261450 RepID=A0A835MBL0_9MAGN|nr:hypothetical protein IFM89_015846 [Coptis chinensis]